MENMIEFWIVLLGVVLVAIIVSMLVAAGMDGLRGAFRRQRKQRIRS
jgi:type II secretory pathway pseudopilin PulG